MITPKIHPFEGRGFGHAPYAFVGYSRQVFQAVQGAPCQPGTACDYCGTGIMDVYRVRSSDGVTFKVGSDCINKVWAEFDATVPKEFRDAIKQAQRMKSDAARQRRRELLNARVVSAKTLLFSQPWIFANQPHPTPYRAEKGETFHDYLSWCLTNGGAPDSSRLYACQMVESKMHTDAEATL